MNTDKPIRWTLTWGTDGTRPSSGVEVTQAAGVGKCSQFGTAAWAEAQRVKTYWDVSVKHVSVKENGFEGVSWALRSRWELN